MVSPRAPPPGAVPFVSRTYRITVRINRYMASNRESILDQFTRQALPFASAPAIRNLEALGRIVQIAEAGPTDLVLDVACGPGLLVCAFATVVEHATGI